MRCRRKAAPLGIWRKEREGEQEYLRLFSFICELSFDVYLKMRLIEKIADQLREDEPPLKKK